MDKYVPFRLANWRALCAGLLGIVVGMLIFALAAKCDELPAAPSTHRRTIDRDFLLVEAAKAAAYSWDGATTIHAQNLGCTEQNPFIGARPAPHKVAAFLGAEFAASTLLDYLIKRSVGHKRGWRAWRAVPLVFGAVHGIAGAVTVSNGCF